MSETNEAPTAHTLTLEFGRFLTTEEWRTVVEQVKVHVPHVQGLIAHAVADTHVDLTDTTNLNDAAARVRTASTALDAAIEHHNRAIGAEEASHQAVREAQETFAHARRALVYVALGSPPSADASDPHAPDPGKLSQRDEP